jgi:hypothetical protein
MLNTDQAIEVLQKGGKVQACDWEISEFIQYDPSKGVVDEAGNPVDASTLVINLGWREVVIKTDIVGYGGDGPAFPFTLPKCVFYRTRTSWGWDSLDGNKCYGFDSFHEAYNDCRYPMGR